MRIGIISDSEAFIPLAYTLAQQQVQVYIFYSPSADAGANHKVLFFLEQTGLPVTQEKSENDLYEWLCSGQYDSCFVLGYPRRIKSGLLNGLQTPIYNVHFGPLPAFKGPSPVFWQLKQGNDFLGLAIHRMTEKLDDGPLLWSKETPNLPHYNYQSVNLMFRQMCVEGVMYILYHTASQILVPEIDKSISVSAYYKRPVLEDVQINWNVMEARDILNLIKACNPWNKGAITFYQQQEVKLMDAQITQQTSTAPAGTIVDHHDGGLLLSTCDNQVLSITMIYWNDFFMSGYKSEEWGFKTGERLGQ